MAIIYNGRIGVLANELIIYNPKRNRGGKNGFLSEGTYQSMVKRGQLYVLQRSAPGKSAIIDYDTMRDDIKKQYVVKSGDPRAQLAAQLCRNVLEDSIVYSTEAFEYYTNTYRYDEDKKLPPAKIDEYTMNVRVIEAILSEKEGHRAQAVGSKERIPVWERLCNLSNDLLTLRDPLGKPLFPHTLPKNAASLRRKCCQYEAARRISKEEGYRSLIHKNYGNKSAAIVQDEDGEAILHKLISLHNNLNSKQIMDEYNKVAEVMGLKVISSPVTVDGYKKKMELTTMSGRRGKKVVSNTRMMQIHRTAPTQALTYWTLDGWKVELLYQKQDIRSKNENGNEKRYKVTNYTHRKTAVIVLDASCKYPVGYAIGDNESSYLIREALRNAIRHTKQLFGKRYKPLNLQSDNYGNGSITPFYQAMSHIYVPAAKFNAKAKIIEPYFHYLNVEYCQKQANWSGYGITSRKENQPNLEMLNEHRKMVPDEATCIGQIEAMIEAERAKHLEEFMAAWERTGDSSKLPFSDEEYLLLMGETSGRTNHVNGDGLRLEIQGERINYDTFDISLREHYNEDWIVRYDPEDMSRVLISNAVRKGLKDAGKEIGNLRYIMQRCMKVPMALTDQKPEHFEYRNKVKDFNDKLKKHIADKEERVDERIKCIHQRIPELINNTLLDRYLITNSRGQHKDERERMRKEADEAEFEELTSRDMQPATVYDDDDYEFDQADMQFSR